MIGLTRKFACMFALVAGLTGLITTPSSAQQRDRLAKADAPVVVDGLVQQVFRSVHEGRTDYLIQINVKRSEAQTALSPVARSRFPAPGESIYVHVSQRLDQAGRPIAGESHKAIPEERFPIGLMQRETVLPNLGVKIRLLGSISTTFRPQLASPVSD